MKKWLLSVASLGVAVLVAYWFFHAQPPPPAPGLDANRSQIPSVAAPVTVGGTTSAPSLQPMAIVPGAAKPPDTASNVSPAISTAPAKPAAAVPPRATTPLPESPSGIAPAILLENMRTTLRQYGLMFGGNPVGTNPEITKALNGSNPKQVNFLGPDGNRVNEKGELCDAWGTPYFFHQLSAMEMEIRSAGPDRIFYNEDDLVIK